MQRKHAVLAVLLIIAGLVLMAGLLTAWTTSWFESIAPSDWTPKTLPKLDTILVSHAESEPQSEPEEPVSPDFTGWKQSASGKWRYYQAGQKATGWVKLDGTWYLLEEETGIMLTGWQQWEGNRYFLDSSGAMCTGWVQDQGKRYFLDKSGAMLTGFIHDGEDWCYLDDTGAYVEGYTEAALTANGRSLRIVDGVAYVDGILIVNKKYPLPRDYAPGGLTQETRDALTVMQQAAAREGLFLRVVSGYRSYDYQNDLYQYYVSVDGQAEADRYSARPGYSEHQTGLAVDINSASADFTGTPEAKWIEEHAHEYGFILRYPADKEHITGYMYESWHLRYLGLETAQAVYDSGLCLEEYLGISSYYTK